MKVILLNKQCSEKEPVLSNKGNFLAPSTTEALIGFELTPDRQSTNHNSGTLST